MLFLSCALASIDPAKANVAAANISRNFFMLRSLRTPELLGSALGTGGFLRAAAFAKEESGRRGLNMQPVLTRWLGGRSALMYSVRSVIAKQRACSRAGNSRPKASVPMYCETQRSLRIEASAP